MGASPSAIRNRLRQIEKLLPQFQQLCEENHSGCSHQAVVAVDETFFGKFMILVMMDLNSGYLLLEEIAEDRCFDTWFEKTTPRLEQLGIQVNHAISDRARALIKLAVSGFECDSGADLFHAQNDVSRFLGAPLGRRLSLAEKAVTQTKKIAAKAAKNENNGSQRTESQQAVSDAEKDLESAKRAKQDYHTHLQGTSDDLHPFSLDESCIHDEASIQSSLESRAQAFEEIADRQGINDRKGAMKKFRKQFTALAASVTFWWTWVADILQQLAMNEEQHAWFTTTLLPVIYWHQRMRQAKNRKSKDKYGQAWEKATARLQGHPMTAQMTASELQRWQTLAENMARQFHRSSSAVEGRNGFLSQMYHMGRGFTEMRLMALTVIYNYFIKRADGTTAAMRLFGSEHPDLFKWLVGQMGDLPLPRKGRERVVANPLRMLDVPS